MNKTRLLLASLLKPINDSRQYEKLGLSLGQLPALEVHICGFKAPEPEGSTNIQFHALFSFTRLSVGRLAAQLKYLRFLFKLKPQVLIIGTHELLLSSLVYKLFYACTLIYDIRENYYLNLTTQQVYPAFISYPAATLIRGIENLAAPFINYFFLAEESYSQELAFIKNRYLVLPNKFKPPATYTQPAALHTGIKVPSTGPVQLLYSGTISELYGIFDAIRLIDAMHRVNARFSLLIIGYWPQAAIGDQVKKLIQNKPYITLIGGDDLVPHTEIIRAITTSHVGLLPYHSHPSLNKCVPTKLYEYLAHALPLIIQVNDYWQPMVNKYKAGLPISFASFNPENIITVLSESTFYDNVAINDILWETEENKLIHFFKSTILNT